MERDNTSSIVSAVSTNEMTYGANIGAYRTLGAPVGYKLKKKSSGELVLMQARQWTQGAMGGIEWYEIETELEDGGV